MIFLKQLELGPLANFVYLFGDAETKECAVVDPAWDVPTILKTAKESGHDIKKILITHNHPDHTNGVGELLRSKDVPVYIHEHDAYALKEFKDNLKIVQGGDSAEIGGLTVHFLHTPGHTHGSQCFRIQDRLVSGDTLFIQGCGRVDLPNSDPEKMYQSLRKISALSEDTWVLPGHNYAEKPTAQLKEEKKENPYLAGCQTDLNSFLRLIGC